jgi:hypothetical protein
MFRKDTEKIYVLRPMFFTASIDVKQGSFQAQLSSENEDSTVLCQTNLFRTSNR